MEKKANKFSQWFISRPTFTGLLFFIVMLSLISLIVTQRYQLFQENKYREIKNIASGVEQNLEQALRNGSTVALTLALTLDNKGIPHNFENVAAKLIKSTPSLQAVELVPAGVIKYIYPLKGNEEALNLDLFKSPPHTVVEVKRAINSRKMYYQGPVRLNQGEMGVIGRLPLYINDKFWGFSAIVIKLDTLFKNAGIDNKKYKDYRFQFSKLNPITKEEEFFLPEDHDISSLHSHSVFFPDGDWKLYVFDIDPYGTWWIIVSALIFGFGLTGLSSYLLTSLLQKQLELLRIVNHQASQLMDTESKFKKIFDYAAIGIGRVNSVSGKFLEVNQYLCNFLGYTERELMDTKIKSVIYPADLNMDQVMFKKLLRGEIRQFDKEVRYLNKQGEVIWGNVIITPLWNEGEEPSNHILIIEDVSIRKLEEQRLIASQQRIASLINTIDGIVWEGNPQDMTFTFISNKVEDILGYTVEEWLSSPTFWLDHLYEEDKKWIMPYLHQANIAKKQHDLEYRLIAKDGAIVWVRDIVSFIEEPGESLKLRGITIDITERKQAEDALNNSFTLVNEQNKRLMNFSYIVSHNLRSHSSNIQGIAALIESAKSEDDRNEMIQLLKKVSSNLNETLFNLNNIVNIQTSMDIIIEPLNLNEYVQKAFATQNLQILFKEASIINTISDDVIVNYNRAYLESILLNLITNALRYSHADRKPVISISCNKENEQMVLQFSDNGVGIDLKKYGDKMFGIYQTFNGNADARGFGLYITKNQVEAMGGTILVESELNEGASFKIYFKD